MFVWEAICIRAHQLSILLLRGCRYLVRAHECAYDTADFRWRFDGRLCGCRALRAVNDIQRGLHSCHGGLWMVLSNFLSDFLLTVSSK